MTIRYAGQLPRYPWRKWLMGNRKRLKIIRGVDYAGRPDTMAVQVRAAARKYGKQVGIRIQGDILDITIS